MTGLSRETLPCDIKGSKETEGKETNQIRRPKPQLVPPLLMR